MLKPEDIEALLAIARIDPSLCDEVEAFLTQSLDVGLFTNEERAHEIRVELARLKPSDEGVSPQLLDLHSRYNDRYRQITRTHNRRSLEAYLRTEVDEKKRKAAYEQFLQDADCPELFAIILDMLARRGPDYARAKAKQLSYQGDIDELIASVGASIAADFKALLNGGAEPCDFFVQFRNQQAKAPLGAYKAVAFGLLEAKLKVQILLRPDLRAYHEEVEVYELRDDDGVLGFWHIDFFQREGKYRGAWTQTTRYEGRPLAFVGFNLERDCLSFNESRTLLHELGHALEHCLCRNPQFKMTSDTNEISSLYAESLMTDPSLLALFDCSAETLRQSRARQKLLDLAQICLLSQVDLDLHRHQFKSAAELKQVVADTISRLQLPHPLITPKTITLFEHAFADEDYASTYHSYLLCTLAAQDLEQADDTRFSSFWRKESPYVD